MSRTPRKLVPLSDERSLTVGVMRWQAYKALKSEVMRFVAADLPTVFADGKVQTEVVASMLDRIGEAVDSLNQDFVRGCVTNPDAFDALADSLTIEDMAALFDAAAEVNPLESILALEKNSPAGLLARRSGLLGLVEKAGTEDAGGSGSSASSYDPGGESQTSTD